MARSARTQRLEVGVDVGAVMRAEEAGRVHDLRDLERVRCASCGGWIEPASCTPTSVSLALDGDRVIVQYAHAECSPSRADLPQLVVLAESEPLGIDFVQALHPDAGAVLIWERKLDLRVRGLDAQEDCLYLDPDWWEGFHTSLADEPVRLLARWLLTSDREDLVLRHGERTVERFYGAREHAPPGWLQSLNQSGFCLLIVGAGMQLRRPRAGAIQRSIRERRALMGLAEFDI